MKAALKPIHTKIIHWAEAHEAVRAMIFCGSLARQTNPGDEYADLDYEMFVSDFAPFTQNQDWLQQFGDYWTHLHLREGDAEVFLALYDRAEKVDFHVMPNENLVDLVQKQQLNSAFYRGYQVVVDKVGLAAQLPPPSLPPHQLPSADEFAFTVNAFWYGVVYVAKQIRRRNLWVVKFRDWTSKESLLRMMEWHAQAWHGNSYETWNDGHFLTQWTDAETAVSLQHIFGRFEAADSWRALLATMALFRRLARETAIHHNFPYLTQLDENASTYIQALFETDDLS